MTQCSGNLKGVVGRGCQLFLTSWMKEQKLTSYSMMDVNCLNRNTNVCWKFISSSNKKTKKDDVNGLGWFFVYLCLICVV